MLLSAIIAPGGTSDQALRAVMANARLVVSSQLVQRFVVRASDAKFRRWFTMGDARTLAEKLWDAAEIANELSDIPRVVAGDPSDDYLVALARENGAVLLTGDRGIHRLSLIPLFCPPRGSLHAACD